MDARTIIEKLGLEPLPREGGHFVETYRSRLRIPRQGLPDAYAGDRSAGTAIYYLLTPDSFSALHRLRSDEIYHFYLGDPVELLILSADGGGEVVRLGNRLEEGMHPQLVVPGGCWQGSGLEGDGAYALLGTTVAPGFEFEDFELGSGAELMDAYPEFASRIDALTRDA